MVIGHNPLAMLREKIAGILVLLFLVSSSCGKKELNQEHQVQKREYKSSACGLRFVRVPAGSVTLRGDDLKPTTVTLRNFYISETEVTNEQFETLISHPRPRDSNLDDSPASCITINDIQTFLKELSKKDKRDYRLPTDAEWEFAASGGLSNKLYPWGDGDATGKSRFAKASAGPVKEFAPNNFGLYGCVGNVEELLFVEYKSGLPWKPVQPSENLMLVARGGHYASWLNTVLTRVPTPANLLQELPHVGIRLVFYEKK